MVQQSYFTKVLIRFSLQSFQIFTSRLFSFVLAQTIHIHVKFVLFQSIRIFHHQSCILEVISTKLIYLKNFRKNEKECLFKIKSEGNRIK